MTSILMEELKRKTFCLFWPLPGHLPHYVVNSPPPSKDSCVDFCFKCESGYSWYDLQGKGRYSNTFRGSFARAYCSL